MSEPDEPAFDPAFTKHLLAQRRDVERDNAACPHCVTSVQGRRFMLPENACPWCWKRWAAYHERRAAVANGMLAELRRRAAPAQPKEPR